MPESRPPEFGINSWLEDELYQEYLHDHKTVDDSWKKVFESNGGAAATRGNGAQSQPPSVVSNGTPVSAAPAQRPVSDATSGEQLIPLRGAAARIAENMNASLSIPI